MTWARIDTTFLNNPKTLGLTDHQACTFLRLILWSVDAGTAGLISAGCRPTFVRHLSASRLRALLAKLSAAGLLDEEDGGYRIHDFEQYQRPVDPQVRAVRAKVGRVGGQRSGEVRKARQQSKQIEAICFDSIEATLRDVVPPLLTSPPYHEGWSTGDEEEETELTNDEKAHAVADELGRRDADASTVAVRSPAAYRRRCVERRWLDQQDRIRSTLVSHPTATVEALADIIEPPAPPPTARPPGALCWEIIEDDPDWIRQYRGQKGHCQGCAQKPWMCRCKHLPAETVAALAAIDGHTNGARP